MPRRKMAFFFSFADEGDLVPLRGGRGEFIVYSPSDYLVSETRQQEHGLVEKSTENQL